MEEFMTPEELEQEAKALSSFDGHSVMQYGGEAVYMYTGDEDDMLEFDGDIQNFSAEGSSGKQFTFTITNANAASRTAVIFAGYLTGNATLAPGQLVTGAFNDKAGQIGLSGASNVEKTIEELRQYLLYIPSRVIQMKVQSDVAAQIQNDFILKSLSPFKTTESKQIRPKDFQNQAVFQDKLVTFKTDFQVDHETVLEYPLSGTSVTSITMWFGAAVNIATSLRKKASKAKRNIAVVGQRNVLAASSRKLIG